MKLHQVTNRNRVRTRRDEIPVTNERLSPHLTSFPLFLSLLTSPSVKQCPKKQVSENPPPTHTHTRAVYPRHQCQRNPGAARPTNTTPLTSQHTHTHRACKTPVPDIHTINITIRLSMIVIKYTPHRFPSDARHLRG